MATIRRVKNKGGTVWRAEVYVHGARESKRFESKPDAQSWAMAREHELSRSGAIRHGMTMRDALERYAAEVAPTKRGERWELIRLRRAMRDPIADVPLQSLELEDAEQFRERRLVDVKAASVARELTGLRSVVKAAVRWRWIEAFPWDGLELPQQSPPRTRTFTGDEISRIVAAAGLVEGEPIETRRQEVACMFLVSLQSAMRLGEVCTLTWSNVDLERRVAHLPTTKNGRARDVPLSSRAAEVLSWQPRRESDRVFRPDPQNASVVFRRIRLAAGVDGARFHDARRHACTELAKKLSPMDLARVAGANIELILRVYYRADAEALARLLD